MSCISERTVHIMTQQVRTVLQICRPIFRTFHCILRDPKFSQVIAQIPGFFSLKVNNPEIKLSSKQAIRCTMYYTRVTTE